MLILDGSIFPDLYRPTDHWRVLIDGTPFDSVHLPSGQEVPDPAGYTHIILTGSEESIIEQKTWHQMESQAVRRAIDQGGPILASCFGHQLLAKTLSGPQYVRRSPVPELGWISIDVIEDDPLFYGLKNPFDVFVSHFDEVIDPPAPWKIIAKSGQCAAQVMRFGDRVDVEQLSVSKMTRCVTLGGLSLHANVAVIHNRSGPQAQCVGNGNDLLTSLG